VLLRDRLRARLDEMGDGADHQRLAAEVLGIRGAPADLARRLVAQALVMEDRRDAWSAAGERICAAAPRTAGVYILRDGAGGAIYVGKAINLQRRLRAHFAGRRWRGLKAAMSRVESADWREVGSELEALLREAELIGQLEPAVNVQTGEPRPSGRAIPAALRRDVIVLLPSIDGDSVELIAARADGGWSIARARRSGEDLDVHAARLQRFFRSRPSRASRKRALAPIVFSWLANRGAGSTRLDPHDASAAGDLQRRLMALFEDDRLFVERLDQR
jgi:predicted GIY-YIG superfamily endonuclease